MAVTPSTMLSLGSPAPDFILCDAQGKEYKLQQLWDKNGIVIAFICNHCPFVLHILAELNRFSSECQQHNLAFIAINSNDSNKYTDDNPQGMLELIAQYQLNFPYLIDENQSIAKAYQAACTPDFYIFNQNKALVYRGRFDDSTPRNNLPTTGSCMRNAMKNILANQAVIDQTPSIGCNIKWIPGNEPDYYSR
jgi:peroxiredoxin